jgi:branched-chain amino acid transport system permease protein
MELGLELLAALNFSTLPQQLVNGVLLGAIYALIALGYTMVYGVLRLINFAHGEVYMLGAYVALFTAYNLGFRPDTLSTASSSSFLNLLLMILGSMLVCALVGIVIERFAYRPMRGHSRISILITAIGLSLLLQFGGALYLPNSPPPSIPEKVNPYAGKNYSATIIRPSAELSERARELEPAYLQSKQSFEAYLAAHPNESRFTLASPEGEDLLRNMQETQKAFEDVQRRAASSSVTVIVQYGQATMLASALVLMAILTYLVLFTKQGRAMRAVAHDFDSASLMGVNVNSIITFTFVIGSALAGAAAMMTATFLGTPLTTYYGLLPGVKAFVAAVLGGIGNIPGAVIGGLLMGLAENVAIWAGYSNYRDAIAFVILILVLMFKPGGLLGSAAVEKV